MDLFIVTGGSKGLGEQLCLQALAHHHQVINLSRSKPGFKDKNLVHISADLSQPLKSAGKLGKKLAEVDPKSFKQIILINNAGMIGPVGDLTQQHSSETLTHMMTNLVAPVILSQTVAQWALQNRKKLRVINIGSGAGYRPIEGWALYCASKAGLKMYTEVCELELKNSKKIKIEYFSPGVVDTNMQGQIRGLSKKKFPGVEDFKQLKSQNLLRSPQDVASKLVAYCLNPQKYQIKSALFKIEDLE